MAARKSVTTVSYTVDTADLARRGRIGAYVAHSRHDPRETTQKARAAFRSRFEREVDPDGVLSPEERTRRAEAARRAFYARLALASTRARQLKARARRRAPEFPTTAPAAA